MRGHGEKAVGAGGVSDYRILYSTRELKKSSMQYYVENGD